MHSPFNFGRTVKNEFFTNRETEVKKLSSNFTHNINTIIISPRRWGKSSLVEKVASLVRSRSIRVVSIDLFGMRSEEEFYNALANAVIKATTTKTEEWIELLKKFAKNITPKLTIDLGEKQSFDLSLDLDIVKKHYRELLDIPQRIATEKKIKIVICIDEFQNIAAFSDPLSVQKRLRSAWQQHDNVSYCLYGSKQHMMMELFNRQSHPFYRFGEIIYLSKIAEAKWQSFIMRQFEATGKRITAEQAQTISRLVQNHPYYVQQLSHLVWVNTEKKTEDATISAALLELVNQNALLYYRETEELNNTELKLLKAILAAEPMLTSRDTIARYGLGTSAGVIKARGTLIKKELIDEEKGWFHIVDPAYELWFRINILKETIGNSGSA